ncbi:Fic family protein [Patescibacteria group bacterium]|nr:Fic family protein [Patescibacteria group bacterium]
MHACMEEIAKQPHKPKALPVEVDYVLLLPFIAKAHAALARLDATLDQLPNPKLLERSFLTQEAVQSSRIEGTMATVQEVFKFEADLGDDISAKKREDIEEVICYRKALEFGVKQIDAGFPLTENMVKELHRILLTSVRGSGKAPGEFRTGQVYIGSLGTTIQQASYIPPEAQHIVSYFSNLEKYLNAPAEQDALVQIAIAHYQFEAIHPFWDGNGRVGRLIISLFLYKQGLLQKPWLYLSEYFERHRQEYYSLLREVSEKGEWSNWITFFLSAVEVQSLAACEKVKEIRALHEKVKDQALSMGSIYAASFAEALFITPIFTKRSIQKIAKVHNFQTLTSLVEKFIQAKVIYDLDPKKKRNKTYVFWDLMKLIS